MTARAARGLLVAAIAVAGVQLGAAAIGSAALGWSWAQVLDSYELTNAVVGACFVVSGTVIAWFVHRNPVGWLLLGSGLAHLATAALFPVAATIVTSSPGSAAGAWIATVASQIWGFGIPGLFLVALLLFPDGRLPVRHGGVLIVIAAIAAIGQCATGVLDPGSMLPGYVVRSPLALPTGAPDAVFTALDVAGAVSSLGVLGTLVLRWVRGDDLVRRQLLWIVLAVLAIFVLNLQRFLSGDGPIPLLLTFVLVPVAIAIAIVRHGLLDIRLVLSRTVVSAVLVAAIVAVYAGLVAAATLLLPPAGDRGAAVVAAIVVAFAANPLRLLLQRTIGRALYGERHDPARVASRLGGELAGATDTLDGVLALARRELRLPRLAVVDGDRTIALSGTAVTASARLPLPGPTPAVLEVGLRPGERVLHDADRRALGLIAAPIAVALRAISLNAALGAARAAVVDEREVERQRLQRELHDGVGPRLTGVAFQLDAAGNLVHSDAAAAADLLAAARTELRSAIRTVRDVVHDLRPIELETTGLEEAVRSRAAALVGGTATELRVEMDARLPERSAAVDAALYRVVVEAVTNAVRHAAPSRCTVRLRSTRHGLEASVVNDGSSEADWRPGVGMASMRFRVEEVGGTLEAGPAPDGWAVVAVVPVTTRAPLPA